MRLYPILTVVLLNTLLSANEKANYYEIGNPNTYEIVTGYEFSLKGDPQVVTIWLPLPEKSPFHKTLKIESNLHGQKTGNIFREFFVEESKLSASPIPYLYALWELQNVSPGKMTAGLTMKIETMDRRLRRESLPQSVRFSNAIFAPSKVVLPIELEAVAQNILSHNKKILDVLTAISIAVTSRLRYSIDADTLTYPRDNLAQTWDLRKGHCEQYTYLFIALANRAGIPARAVHGFMMQSQPDYPLGTHTWAEVYLTGPGWVEVEPQAMNDVMGDIFFIPGYVRTGALKWPGHSATGNVSTAYGQRIESLKLVSGDKLQKPALPKSQIILPNVNGITAKAGEPVRIRIKSQAANRGFIKASQVGVFSVKGGWKVIGITHLNPGEVVWIPEEAGEYWLTPFTVDNRGNWSVDTPPETKPKVIVR